MSKFSFQYPYESYSSTLLFTNQNRKIELHNLRKTTKKNIFATLDFQNLVFSFCSTLKELAL